MESLLYLIIYFFNDAASSSEYTVLEDETTELWTGKGRGRKQYHPGSWEDELRKTMKNVNTESKEASCE